MARSRISYDERTKTYYYVAICGTQLGGFDSWQSAAEGLGYHMLGCEECM